MTRYSRQVTRIIAAIAVAACLSAGAAAQPAAPAAAQQSAPREASAAPPAAPETAAPPAPGGDDRGAFLAEVDREATVEGPSAGGLLLRTFGALLLIVGLIAGVAWGLRRFGGARFGAPNQDAPDLAVLATVGLGERRSLSVVRFGERTLLLGATGQSITLLAEEDDGLTAARPVRSVAEMLKSGETPSFGRELSVASRRLSPVAAAIAAAEALEVGDAIAAGQGAGARPGQGGED